MWSPLPARWQPSPSRACPQAVADAEPGSTAFPHPGIEAERQLAHYLCRKFGQDPRVDLFFGLRLPLEKTSNLTRHDAVQIDVLLVHLYGMAIVESKSVHDLVRVNSREEWCRTWRGKAIGIPSPVEQAKRQSDALRKLLQDNREQLRGRVVLGMLQGGFKSCSIDCFVAISDSGRIVRAKGDQFSDVMKADQMRVLARVERHQKFGGVVGQLRGVLAKEDTGDGDWSMTDEERGRGEGVVGWGWEGVKQRRTDVGGTDVSGTTRWVNFTARGPGEEVDATRRVEVPRRVAKQGRCHPPH